MAGTHDDSSVIFSGFTDKTGRELSCRVFVPRVEIVPPIRETAPKLSNILTTMVGKHHVVGRPANVITAGRIAYCMLQMASVSEIDRVGSCGFYWHENHNGNKHTGANHIYIGAGGQSKEIAVDGYEANYHHLDKSCLAKCFTDEGLECTVSSGCNTGGGDKSLSFKIPDVR